MVIDGVARRPGLVLAVCAWVAFAALAAAAVYQAVRSPGSFRVRVYFASAGFGELPAVCLLVAAMLVIVEQLTSTVDEFAARIVAWVVLGSAVVAVAMTAAGVIVLPTWSFSTSTSDKVVAVSPSLIAATLATLAALLALHAGRHRTATEYAR